MRSARNKLFQFLLAIVFLGCSGQAKKVEDENGWQKYQLRGKVKSFTEHVHIPESSGEMMRGATKCRDGSCNRDVYFNKEGYEEEIIGYDLHDRHKTGVKDFFYDSSHHLIREEEHRLTDHPTQGSGIITFTYRYDEQGKVIQTTGISDQMETVNIATEYNDLGQVSKQVFKGYTTIGFTYDEKGRKAGYSRYRDNGALFSENKFEYDDQDHLIRHEYKNIEQRTTEVTTRTYNTRGDVVTETVESESKKKTSRYTYEYDQQNNWVKKSVFSEDQPNIVVERTLEYYP